MGPRQIAEKTMRFFRFYAINRHKATIITPSIHLSAYSMFPLPIFELLLTLVDPDDNRHDLRPFLYVVDFPFQFNKIRAHVDALEKKQKEKADRALD